MAHEWISLAEALGYVSRVLQSRENAKVQLREALQGAKLAARAELVEIDTSFFVEHSFLQGASLKGHCRQRNEVPPRAWELAEIEWEQGSFKRRAIALSPTEDRLGRDLPGYVAREVEVPLGQIRSLWGQENSNELAVTKKKKPGRPPGTGYAVQDSALIEEMRKLIEERLVSSPTAAAIRVARRAEGSETNKVRRLAEGYRRAYSAKNSE